MAAGCSGPPTKREMGTLGGAALGAAAGAIIGHQTGHAAEGAAIGAALGGLGGAAVGDQIQAQDQALDAREQEIARNRALIEELKRKQLDARETRRGVVVNLPDILFEFNRATLTSDARAKVRDIAEILERPNVRNRSVSVEGHTDSIGSEEYNQRLSERRAEAVARALVESGVKEERIRTRGFGEKYPIAPNQTPDGRDNPEGRAKNRRVEVIIEN
jgi:outer membrane protein OmpA-like peptidoglycan-associated protein